MDGPDDFDWLGSAVDLSEDGRVLVASAPENAREKGYVRVWREGNGTWIPYQISNSFKTPKSGERFGHALSVSKVQGFQNAYHLAIGAPFKSASPSNSKAGAVLVYELVFDQLGMQPSPLGSYILGDGGEEVGHSVKLLQDNLLAIGSPGVAERQGSVRLYHFHTDSLQWERADQALDGNGVGDSFGFAVSFARTSDRVLTVAAGATSSNASAGNGYVKCFSPK
jgi:hypothetical protein